MDVCLIQISDLHLGRSFGSLAGPATLGEELADASLQAVRRACGLVGERNAAALLVAGDLFHRPEIDEELTRALQTAFAKVSCPVLVSPGNHDPFGPMSVWNNAALQRLGLASWSQNVHIFTARRFVPRVLLGGALVVHGHCVEGKHTVEESPLNAVALVPEARWNVLLFHGARGGAWFAGRETVPFTPEQLAKTGADYAAVGHYHRYIRIEHEGRLLGAYAGAPVPGEWDEDPHGGILVVRLEEAGPQLECCEVHPGRIARLSVHAADPIEDQVDAMRRIRQAAADAALDHDDIVLVSLTGFSAAQLDPDELEERLRGVFRHAVVRDETQPDAPLATAGGRVTVESQFVASLSEQIEGTEDPQRRARLEEARRYGLAALRGRTLRPPAVVSDSADA